MKANLRKAMRVAGVVLIFALLTALTQVGGFVYLLYKVVAQRIRKRFSDNRWASIGLRTASFVGLWLLFSLLIIPQLARSFGRVPLPLYTTDSHQIRPGNLLLCLANRHYVRPELKEALINISNGLEEKVPGAEIIYLDANFPFIDGFRLLPHLGHEDGRKVDICFVYRDPDSGELKNSAPTWWGYGFAEGPRKGERNQPASCKAKGYWQYGIIHNLVPTARRKRYYDFDDNANRELLRIAVKQPAIHRIYIEPHLRVRLGFGGGGKIGYHGCGAVRHDDHIHLQM